jgi:hypothetical protein
MNTCTGWVAITAGLGSGKYLAAANRLAEQLNQTGLFDEIHVIDQENLETYCPRTLQKYRTYLNTSVPGYGYWSWKPEAVQTVLEKNPKKKILWIDSGCEFNGNSFSIRKLRTFFDHADKFGVAAFSLATPENQYTKRYVIRRVNPGCFSDESNQFQATWFIISGNRGEKIIKKWTNHVLEGIEMIDNVSLENEIEKFQSNRNDQSIFSLLCKKYRVEPITYTAVDGKRLRSKLRGFSHPIWTSRNLTDKSIIQPRMVLIPRRTS